MKATEVGVGLTECTCGKGSLAPSSCDPSGGVAVDAGKHFHPATRGTIPLFALKSLCGREAIATFPEDCWLPTLAISSCSAGLVPTCWSPHWGQLGKPLQQVQEFRGAWAT